MISNNRSFVIEQVFKPVSTASLRINLSILFMEKRNGFILFNRMLGFHFG